MADPVKLSQPIPLKLQLATSKTNLFVRAFLFDQSGSPLNSGTPIPLTHVGNGLYVDNSFAMPNTPFVIVSYQVALDAGFTNLAPQDGSGIDTYSLDDEIPQDIIRRDELIAVIEDQSEVLCQVVDGDDGVLAGYEDAAELSSIVKDDDSLHVQISEDDNLTGVVTCNQT